MGLQSHVAHIVLSAEMSTYQEQATRISEIESSMVVASKLQSDLERSVMQYKRLEMMEEYKFLWKQLEKKINSLSASK